MTPYQKISYYFSNFKKAGIRSDRLALRKVDGISSATASHTKSAVELWSSLTKMDKEVLKAEYPAYYQKIESIASARAESQTPYALSESLGLFFERVKKDSRPIIDRELQGIHDRITKLHKQISDILKESGFDGLLKKYLGDNPTSSERWNFYSTLVYKLSAVISPDLVIKQMQKSYELKEESKIERMFMNLVKKYPQIVDYKMESAKVSRNSLEYVLKGTDKDGAEYTISTQTISAGGHNIQVYHFRWLMSVTDSNGKTVKINTGK